MQTSHPKEKLEVVIGGYQRLRLLRHIPLCKTLKILSTSSLANFKDSIFIASWWTDSTHFIFYPPKQFSRTLYWDGQKKSVKGCWSIIGLLLRMQWVVVYFHSRRLTICKHSCVRHISWTFCSAISGKQTMFTNHKVLLWKQTTTHSLRNNNPMFDGNLWPNSFDQPSTTKSDIWIK